MSAPRNLLADIVPRRGGAAHRGGVSHRGSSPMRGTVLFVHGLWMSGAESFLLKRQLAARGWSLRVFPYSSLAEPMERVARRCARHALQLAQRTEGPVHLLGHSLGGIVIYRMFETGLLPPERFSSDRCRVVFMGTPARGSQTARVLATYGAARRLLGVAGSRDLLQGLPETWPFAPRLGIVAGNSARGLGRILHRTDDPNDGTVCVSETRLEGAADCCVLPVSHTGMCISPAVAAQVASFLEYGRFEHEGGRHEHERGRHEHERGGHEQGTAPVASACAPASCDLPAAGPP